MAHSTATSRTTATAPQRTDFSTARGGELMGSFVRLHCDPTLLAEYEPLQYDGTSAAMFTDLSSLPHGFFSSQSSRVKSEPTQVVSTTHAAKGDLVDSSVSWMLSTMRSPKGEMLCRYRKGKCDNPRTLKKNGNLHSYCELHRQRSIVNQRKFDRKKRESLSKRLCNDCKEASTHVHAQPHSDVQVHPQSTPPRFQKTTDNDVTAVKAKQRSSRVAGAGKSKQAHTVTP